MSAASLFWCIAFSQGALEEGICDPGNETPILLVVAVRPCCKWRGVEEDSKS